MTGRAVREDPSIMVAPGIAWRPFLTEDLPAVDAIARAVHAALPERVEVLAEKRALCPRGCMILVMGGAIMGYGFAHPWRLRTIPALDTLIGALPAEPDCLFMHDVALMPSARGHGAVAPYVDHLRGEARATGLARLACVSVYGTQPYWARFGFDPEEVPALRDKLAGYGEGATYMTAPA